MRRLLQLALILAAVISSASARADDDELESGRVVAVEDRPFRLVHEFTVTAGVLPLDALYTGFSLGGSYTLHLTDIWAWEAIGFHYSANINSSLSGTLADRWDVQPTSNPEVEYMINTHAVLTPLHGKFSIFNDNIIQASTYIALGGGLARFTDGFRPQISGGPGLRFFFGQVVSTRLDLRGSIVPNPPEGVDFLLQISLSFSFNFGRRKVTELGEEEQLEDNSTGFEALDELYPLSDPKRNNKEEKSQ